MNTKKAENTLKSKQVWMCSGEVFQRTGAERESSVNKANLKSIKAPVRIFFLVVLKQNYKNRQDHRIINIIFVLLNNFLMSAVVTRG